VPITGSEREFAVVGRRTVFDGIAYWVTLAGVYLMVGGLMFYSGKGKLFDSNGDAPQGIKDQFKVTFLDTFPGVDTAWFVLGASSSASSCSCSRASSASSSFPTATSRSCRSGWLWRF
jgi:hypothetical protein